MPEVKMEVRIGDFLFHGEGDSTWIEKQLDKILEKAESLSKIKIKHQTEAQAPAAQSGHPNDVAVPTLSAYLKSNNATSNQIVKFLATANWLTLKGTTRLQVKDITGALKDSNQTKLSNASDSLGRNITKGFCERDGDKFFVTEEGKESLK